MQKKTPDLGAVPRRSFGEAWTQFWFTPADPTMLCVIRLLCGAVTFYTFFAYTLDLQELLGEHAWLDLEARRSFDREMPMRRANIDWDRIIPYVPAPPPRTEMEKGYYDAYVAKWKVPPPAPYPQTVAEAASYEEYKARWGQDPRVVSSKGQTVWSIWFHVTDPDAMMAVQVVTLLVSFLFLIGFCTRLTGALTWLAALSCIHRAPLSLFGADTMVAVVLLYLNLGPCGAVLSVDRWLARWWARKREQGTGNREQGSTPKSVPSAPLPVPSVSAN